MHKPIFTISLDFELHWGGFEKWPLNEAKKKYFQNTRDLLPGLISLFEKYEVHTSWATVGLLMHENKEQLEEQFPALKPAYREEQLSAYHFIQHVGIGVGEEDDPYHFAHSLVKQIVDSNHQELASHSFAHYYCNEAGQKPEQFDADCKAIQRAAQKYGQNLKSLVFPRNQYNADYLEVCKTNGIAIIRSNPVDWWWKTDEGALNESFWKRLNRGLDAYFNIGGKTSYGLKDIKEQHGVFLLPASRLLRPYNPKELFLNSKKINRIKNEMAIAAKNGEFYHLWWHPHNFGSYPVESMQALVELLKHYQVLKDKYQMSSLNMGEIADQLKSNAFE